MAGRRLDTWPHSKIQIWRKNNDSQNSYVYYWMGNVPVQNYYVCKDIVGDTFWCILQDNFRVSVQPGDILGLELPATHNGEILFTSGGPTNYIFKHPNQLDPNTNLFLNGSSVAQQLPQIIFNLTSGKL